LLNKTLDYEGRELNKTLDYEGREGTTEVKTKSVFPCFTSLKGWKKKKKTTNFGPLPCNHKLAMVCFIQTLGLI